MNKDKDIKYLVYARKSSESNERQVQSIDDQVTIAKGLAKTFDLKIIDIIHEAKSAMIPGKREGFNTLVRRIKKGEAQGIVCWKLDRLARNPEEAGIIIGMLGRGEIQHIKTYEKEFHPKDNSVVTFVEFGIATQLSRDIGANAKRGVMSKVEKGWRPGTAPHGYLNSKTIHKGENTVDPDPERFAVMQEAWQKLLSGTWTPVQVLNWLTNDCGFKTIRLNKLGDKPLGRSSIYRIFTNPFYAGLFKYGGAWYQGKHKPMITIEEYDRAQVILGKRGRPRVRPKTSYAYTSAILCECCGGGMTATRKMKLVKRDGKVHEYTLYYCEHCKRRGQSRSYTNVNLIEEAIERELERLTILPEFRDWALDIIDGMKDETRMSRQKAAEARKKAVESADSQVGELIRLRARGLVDDDEFVAQKNAVKLEQARVLERMKAAEEGADDWLDLTREAFVFSTYAHKAFLQGDAQTRREILSGLAHLNCTALGKQVNIQAVEWLVPIQKFDHPQLTEFEALEPDKRRNCATDERFAPLSVALRGRRDLNPRSLP